MKRSIPSIANTMLPQSPNDVQRKSDITNFTPTNWTNSIQYRTSDLNYFTNDEAFREFKNSTLDPLTGAEPIYGHMNTPLNPLDQEQTGAHTIAYQQFGLTRITGNMNPGWFMRYQPYTYPTRKWYSNYQGSSSM